MPSLNRLTDAAIRRHAPARLPSKLYDGGGLYLHFAPSGAKLWRCEYRFHGKQKLLSFGAYGNQPGEVSLAAARERRREARALLAEGKDPAVERRVAKTRARASSAITFRTTAEEWLTRQARVFAEPTIARYRSVLAQMPDSFSDRPIASLEPPDVLSVVRPMEDEGKRSMAHRCKVFIGLVCRYAVVSGYAQRNPTTDLKGALLPDRPKHYATITNPKDVGALLRAIDGFTAASSVAIALSVLPYVFTRPSELRMMQWRDVDFRASLWTVPAEKTKSRRPHLVPLSKQVAAKLKALPRGEPTAYVFRSPRTSRRPLSEVTLNAALLRLGYTSDQIVPHGFRAMARTLLDEQLRVDPIIIEVQLAHTVPGVLGATYNRALYLERRVKMMQQYADYLDKLRSLR